MIKNAKWIWLNGEIYPGSSASAISIFDARNEEYHYMVAEFQKQIEYHKNIKNITIEVSADVRFWLYVNDKFVGLGPVCAGGDYGNKKPMPYTYYNTYNLEINSDQLLLYAMVQNKPTVQCDMSRGKCGFVLACRINFDDGTEEMVFTDETWLARVNNQRKSVTVSDFTAKHDQWNPAACVQEECWNLKKSPILNLAMEEIVPADFCPIKIEPGESREFHYELDRVYSCYYALDITGGDLYSIEIRDYERFPGKAVGVTESIQGNTPLKFRGLEMKSVGAFIMKVTNSGTEVLRMNKVSVIFSHYPVRNEGYFKCSEEIFNKIYEMGKWSLKICRQTVELDSPKHQENLGCAGDYHIASLMNYFTYGDALLTRFDIVRIADYLEMSEGHMFHTNYSMIWILMLYEYYKFTADKEIFKETKDALIVLLDKFSEYVGEKGVIDHPPNYMFVDWLIVDGLSMHHPPMCLGQSVLNAFYYGGLKTAIKIFSVLGDGVNEEKYSVRAEKLYKAFNECFYDEDKQLYFDGLNDEYVASKWMPENTNKRYFGWHTNSLAVLFELAEPQRAKEILKTVLNDMKLINPQPYFMHFVLEAIYKTGLFETYGIRELKRWEVMTDFEKGLQEGWYDCSGYGFDYSHVWGGTPTYQLPSKLMGFEMIEAGFKKIRLSPRLYGLDYAEIKVPTPYGDIIVNLEKGKKPQIICCGKIQRDPYNEDEYLVEFSES